MNRWHEFIAFVIGFIVGQVLFLAIVHADETINMYSAGEHGETVIEYCIEEDMCFKRFIEDYSKADLDELDKWMEKIRYGTIATSKQRLEPDLSKK